jgi:hypothetical protein
MNQHSKRAEEIVAEVLAPGQPSERRFLIDAITAYAEEVRREHPLNAAWQENLCGDSVCEAVRLEAATLVLKGATTDHKFYARVVTLGKQEAEERDI